MVDASHEKNVAERDKFKAKNVQPDSVGNPNEIQPNLEAILVTQPMSVNITIER
jgi:hypothetical protein